MKMVTTLSLAACTLLASVSSHGMSCYGKPTTYKDIIAIQQQNIDGARKELRRLLQDYEMEFESHQRRCLWRKGYFLYRMLLAEENLLRGIELKEYSGYPVQETKDALELYRCAEPELFEQRKREALRMEAQMADPNPNPCEKWFYAIGLEDPEILCTSETRRRYLFGETPDNAPGYDFGSPS